LAAAALYLLMTYVSDRGRQIIEAKTVIVGNH